MSFINKDSFKCLLGVQSKNAEIINNIAKWSVGAKKHFTNLSLFDNNDLLFLKEYGPSNFHYLMPKNIELLTLNNFKVDKRKLNSTCIILENLAYVGRQYHGIRGAINKNKKLNLTIQDHFNDLSDIKEIINEWSTNYASKYFRNLSGKNTYFYKNNFHKDCNNIFIYDQSKLIAFASASVGDSAAYIIRKALFKQYPGLSEYIDDLTYKKAALSGTKVINLGQSIGNVAKYKDKFPNTYSILHYDGNIK